MSLTSYRAAPPRGVSSCGLLLCGMGPFGFVSRALLAGFGGLAATYSPASWDAVPSARRCLTAEFGMGSGVSRALGPPNLQSPRPPGGGVHTRGVFPSDTRVSATSASGTASAVFRIGSKPVGRLVPVSCTHCCASTSGLSTWWSATALGGDLVSRGASRLDAFSGYPVRT